MRISQLIRLAWRSVTGHSGRSALTVLGVLISVATVVALVTLGGGLQAELAGDIAGDASTVNVWAGPTDGSRYPGGGARPVFTDSDVSHIESMSGVARVETRSYPRISSLTAGNSTVEGQQVVAVNPAYFTANDVGQGRVFENDTREIMLNPAAAKRFETNVSVGDTIRLGGPAGNTSATVVGVLADSQAHDPFDGLGEKPRVYVPNDPFYGGGGATAATDQRRYPVLFVVAERAEQTETVSTRVQSYLETSSDAASNLPSEYAFSLRTNDEFLTVLLDVIRTVAAFILGVAVISLVIGGIGIANTMLVSVLERTHEIGVMKSIGARRSDILIVFFVESLLLSTGGSLLGACIGVVTGFIGSMVIDVPFVIPWRWSALVVGMGITIGAIAGLYPAWRAATIEPVDALQAD